MDQLRFHNITSFPNIQNFLNQIFPTTHGELRTYIIDMLPKLPQFESNWCVSVLTTKEKIESFLRTHKRDTEWTDEDGIVIQATALIIGRRIHIIGTVNYGDNNLPITVIDGGPGSENYPLVMNKIFIIKVFDQLPLLPPSQKLLYHHLLPKSLPPLHLLLLHPSHQWLPHLQSHHLQLL